MKVSMNYSTRKLIVLNQIRGYNEEHLIDNIEFTIPVELTGFNILLTFVQGDDTPIGAVTLATPWTSGTINYVVPIALTVYNHIKYQIVAAHPTTQAVWKSNIGHIYFDDPLPDHGDIPFTELSPYPDWVAAIDAANQATLQVTAATNAAKILTVNATNTALEWSESSGENVVLVPTYVRTTLSSETNSAAIGTGYDGSKDSLMVFKNNVYLTPNSEYTVVGTNIVKTSGTWANGTIFDFVVTQTQSSDAITNVAVHRISSSYTATSDSTTNCLIGTTNWNSLTDSLYVYYQNL